MKNYFSIPATADYSSTKTTVAAVIVCNMIGTGGACVYLNDSVKVEQSANEFYSPQLGLKNVDSTFINPIVTDFRALCNATVEDYGLNIKQFSEIMHVTRAAVYKWLDKSQAMERVRDTNVVRINLISDILSGIRKENKNKLGAWLQGTLDKEANEFMRALSNHEIDFASLKKLIPEINSALRSLGTSDSLNELLGIE
ncbi:hypothetical protein NQT74_05875 [Alteromonas stellipolaris]|uniref:hypothetical protein n=1 Tax=Alteromonas stellipolaris TaxID=233316 RepID=UPI0021192E94|nr:hypothetical protein [Alteromonas stellipolaris]MCQ8848099.1 hypothetical protein [Alteromonas stellipolaris]